MNTAVLKAALCVPLAMALAGCEDGEGFPSFGNKAEETGEVSAAARSSETVLKDVERPDIFNVSEAGLWDGRPSLGGVWVAHPDIKTPERAKITNTANGKVVAGALFRRERDNPGPRIQVSSEAAAALGMIAGQPAELAVLVVRQEEVEIEPEPLPISEEAPGEADAALAAATVDDSGIDTAGAETPQVAAKPKRGNFLQRLFGGNRNRAPAAGAVAGTAAATVDDASAPDVQTTSLDTVTTGAAAAIDRAEADDKPKPRPAQTASAVRNPYIQVGLFSVEANADAAAANLRQSGIVPTVLAEESNGVLSWRVVVGPVATENDQAAVLAQVKNLGYSDAFLTPK